MRLTKREKMLVGILLILFIFYMTNHFVFKPQMLKIDEHKLRLEEAMAKVQKAKADIKHIDALEDELASLQNDMEDSMGVFYPAILQKKMIIILDQVLSESNLISEQIVFSETEKVDNDYGLDLEKLTVTISYHGSYEQVFAFIEKIEEMDRMIKVDHLQISRHGENEVKGSININFYALNKPVNQDIDKEYLNWTIDKDSGKENPFTD